MVEWIALGAAVGGLTVKAWDFFVESIKSEPELTYAEHEAKKKKDKEDKEVKDWSNRAVLTDSAFESLKKQIEEYSKDKDSTYAYPCSLIGGIIDLNMRFSIKQINVLKSLISHWCMYDGKEDKSRTIANFLNIAKDHLTAKTEAKEVILNILIEEKI